MHGVRVGRISDGIYVNAVALPRPCTYPEQLGRHESFIAVSELHCRIPSSVSIIL